mgnify:CR=1 FL=1
MAREIDYGGMMHRAMQGLIADVLHGVAQDGLPGEHHFFITFDTRDEGVEMADWLRERYPEEMTIVIQHWFDNLTVDDEGTPPQRNVLIEDGILVGYMQDRQNARLMGMKPTGNGRRQSYAHVPMPRMTNTYMLAGDRDPAEIIASVKNGMYAANFGGGQVDITSGKYVFQCTEAYKIENGKLGAPLKGAMLIGNGPTDLHRITMIGNDLELDTGIGTCGKNGQGVPVGVGQPTLRMERITVGGTG